jgi:hypothetical protein
MANYSNLPVIDKPETQRYFEEYFVKERGVSQNFYDSAIAFFEQQTNGNKLAAANIVAALIEVVKTQNLDPNELLDNFRTMSMQDINMFMVTALNFNRKNTSFLGFRTVRRSNALVDRTLLP